MPNQRIKNILVCQRVNALLATRNIDLSSVFCIRTWQLRDVHGTGTVWHKPQHRGEYYLTVPYVKLDYYTVFRNLKMILTTPLETATRPASMEGGMSPTYTPKPLRKRAAIIRIFFSNCATAPSGPGSPHYRQFTITLSYTHHTW
jgi:hypothetical protein